MMIKSSDNLASLTLMAVMGAVALAFAIPGAAPDVAAEPKEEGPLSVSSDVFGGPMVLEVKVTDRDGSDGLKAGRRADARSTEVKVTDRDGADGQAAEPDVTFNGRNLRMVQGTDGTWYAYVAHRDHADTLEEFHNTEYRGNPRLSGPIVGVGLDFGDRCTADEADALIRGGFDEDAIIYANIEDCSSTGTDSDPMNVLRTAKAPVSSADTEPGNPGRAGVVENAWPFIQTWGDFIDDETFTVEYDGNVITMEYDVNMDDRASHELDREDYPPSAEVHVTINDSMLNIDPTDEDVWTFDTDTGAVYYDVFDEDGTRTTPDVAFNYTATMTDMSFGDSGILMLDDIYGTLDFGYNGHNSPDGVPQTVANLGDRTITFQETRPNSGTFSNTDDAHDSNLDTKQTASKSSPFAFGYAGSTFDYFVGFTKGHINMIPYDIGDGWISSAAVITDPDFNKNTRANEDLDFESGVSIPTLEIGSPFTLADVGFDVDTASNANVTLSMDDRISKILTITFGEYNGIDTFTLADAKDVPTDLTLDRGSETVYQYVNYHMGDLRPHLDMLTVSTGNTAVVEIPGSDLEENGDLVRIGGATAEPLEITLEFKDNADVDGEFNIVLDVFAFGQDDGSRYNDAIYRLLAEETRTGSSVYEGDIYYVMVNQINLYDEGTFGNLDTIEDTLDIIVHENLTGEDAVSLTYLDRDSEGTETQTSAELDALRHSGKVSFDRDSYRMTDTVTITLEDMDLNVDDDTRDKYDVVKANFSVISNQINASQVELASTYDRVGLAGIPESVMLEVAFDGEAWQSCFVLDDDGTVRKDADGNDVTMDGLSGAITNIRETGTDTGVFTASFQIPETYCSNVENGRAEPSPAAGRVLGVTYYDFKDASGEEMEISADARIDANTGSVSLDRNLYPVPFGGLKPGVQVADGRLTAGALTAGDGGDLESESYFPLHPAAGPDAAPLAGGDVTVHVRVSDLDFTSGTGMNAIAMEMGPVKIYVSRGSSTLLLGTAGGTSANDGYATVGDHVVFYDHDGNVTTRPVPLTKEFGPITEIHPGAGIFELDVDVRYSHGPYDDDCPQIHGGETGIRVISGSEAVVTPGCILRGDVLTVEYIDPTDSGGQGRTVTASATFDLMGSLLLSDKPEYVIGSDMILTLVDPDLNMDIYTAETIPLDLIGWDSDAAELAMGALGGAAGLTETGADTSIFLAQIEIPRQLFGENLDRGEAIELEYVDMSPPFGARYVGEDVEYASLDIITSNYGAAIELDRKSYAWTDKVFITVTAPDYNLDSNSVDEIGSGITVSAGGSTLYKYKLTETDTDTGVFVGEVILEEFPGTDAGTDGFAESDRASDDGGHYDVLSVSFESAEDETVTASALIRRDTWEPTPPLERIQATNPRIVDSLGNAVSSVSAGQQVQIATDLTSVQLEKIQPFVYMVQVQDENGVTVNLSWFRAILNAGQSGSPAAEWLPTEPGTYGVTVFVWESLDHPMALSPPATLQVT